MRTRSIRTWLIAASVAVPLAIGPAVSFADPSFGPLLAGDKLLGTAGRPPAKVGFAASDWIGGPLGYLAVWSQYTDSLTQADIYGQYLTATGESLTGDLAPWGNPFLIASHPGNQDNPIVAYDGQSYFVVWQDQGGPTTALVGRRVYGCCDTGGGG